MGIKMKALKTYSGDEGFVLAGKEVEVKGKDRAKRLHELKIADYVEQKEKAKSDEKDTAVNVDKLRTHDELDAFAKENGVKDYPFDDEDAKVKDKQEAIKAHLAAVE